MNDQPSPERRQAIDARRIVLLAVGVQTFVTALVVIERQIRSLLLEAHARHSVTTGVRDAGEVDHDDGSNTPVLTEAGKQLGKEWIAWHHDLRSAVQPHDPGALVECTEHDHDAPVVSNVGDGLRTAPGQVQIGDGVLVEDHEGSR